MVWRATRLNIILYMYINAYIEDVYSTFFLIKFTLFYEFGHHTTWWRLRMETFSALLTICEGNHRPPGPWIPLTKASDAELWCLLWSAPKQTVEQTIETPVIWDAIALILTSLQWAVHHHKDCFLYVIMFICYYEAMYSLLELQLLHVTIYHTKCFESDICMRQCVMVYVSSFEWLK